MNESEREERRFTTVVGVVVAATVLTAALLFLTSESTSLSAAVSGVAQLGAGTFAAWSCFRAARLHPRAYRKRAWSLLAGIGLTFVVSGVIRIVAAAAGDPNAWGWVANLVTLACPPLALGATFGLTPDPMPWRIRARTILDGIIVAAVLFLIAWVGYLQPNLPQDVSVLSWVISTGHVFGGVLMGVAGITALVARTVRNEVPLHVLGFLFVAIGCFIAIDTVQSFGMFEGFYRPGLITDAGWVACMGALGLGAFHPRQYVENPRHVAPPAWMEVLPTFVAGVVLLCLFPPIIRSGLFSGVTMALSGSLFAAVLVRQFFAVLEEQRVTRLLTDLMNKRTKQYNEKERRFEALVQHSSDAIIVVNTDAKITYASPSVSHVFGIAADDLVHQSLDALVAESDQPRVRALFAMASRKTGVTMTAEWRAVKSDGVERHVEVLLRNLTEEAAIGGTVLNLRDVTDRKELQDQLTHQAMHDHLTGLPNRAKLLSNIESGLARWLFQGELFSLLVVDLDDFKSINDSFGHLSGDIVLQILAQRLQRVTRRGDTLVRLGGNEFAILMPGVAANDDEAQRITDRVSALVQEPMEVEGRLLTMRASMGLACVSDAVSQPDDILRNADLALHHAKSTKRGGSVAFEISMHESAIRRAEMVADLSRALENEELQLYFQPTVELSSGRFEGVEALLRWPHPERGFVSPADFIPVAEEAGLIVPIGTWVLRQACRQMSAWQARYPSATPLVLNVNLSGRQLAEPDVVETVRTAIEDSGIVPGTLVLEMTESVLMDDNPETLAKMQAICDLGVELSIDDFGTGYSSLSYLRQFPISVLKIDRAFVMNLGEDGKEGDTALVQAIVDLAGTLRLRTVAEGIETPYQLALLRSMGCDIGQGFLMAKPAPAEEVRRMLEQTVGANAPIAVAALPGKSQTVG